MNSAFRESSLSKLSAPLRRRCASRQDDPGPSCALRQQFPEPPVPARKELRSCSVRGPYDTLRRQRQTFTQHLCWLNNTCVVSWNY